MVKWSTIFFVLIVMHGAAIIWLTHSAQHKIKEHRLMKPPVTWPDGSIPRYDRSISWPVG